MRWVRVGNKRPSFQFYPSDWQNDIALNACSFAAKGLWVDLMCLMHSGNPYGTLTFPNGVAMSDKDLIKTLRTHPKTLQAMLKELSSKGVIKRQENGIYYSKRMVEDERIRCVRAEAGKAGGEANLLKQKIKQNTPPSSSSSSSSSFLSLSKQQQPLNGRTGSDVAVAVVAEDGFFSTFQGVGNDERQTVGAGSDQSRQKPNGKTKTETGQFFTLIKESGEELREDDWLYCNLKHMVNPKTRLNKEHTLSALLESHGSVKTLAQKWMLKPMACRMAACICLELKPGQNEPIKWGLAAIEKSWEEYRKELKATTQWVESGDFTIDLRPLEV